MKEGARRGSQPVGWISRAAVHTSSAMRTSFSLAQKRTISSMFGRSSEKEAGCPNGSRRAARGCTPSPSHRPPPSPPAPSAAPMLWRWSRTRACAVGERERRRVQRALRDRREHAVRRAAQEHQLEDELDALDAPGGGGDVLRVRRHAVALGDEVGDLLAHDRGAALALAVLRRRPRDACVSLARAHRVGRKNVGAASGDATMFSGHVISACNQLPKLIGCCPTACEVADVARQHAVALQHVRALASAAPCIRVGHASAARMNCGGEHRRRRRRCRGCAKASAPAAASSPGAGAASGDDRAGVERRTWMQKLAARPRVRNAAMRRGFEQRRRHHGFALLTAIAALRLPPAVSTRSWRASSACGARAAAAADFAGVRGATARQQGARSAHREGEEVARRRCKGAADRSAANYAKIAERVRRDEATVLQPLHAAMIAAAASARTRCRRSSGSSSDSSPSH